LVARGTEAVGGAEGSTVARLGGVELTVTTGLGVTSRRRDTVRDGVAHASASVSALEAAVALLERNTE